MSGLKTNEMTRKQVMAAVRAITPEAHYVWDGVDEDDRPMTKEELRVGVEAAKRRRGRPAGSDKTQIALRVDNETLAAFRATGQGWQSRMNQVLGQWAKSAHS